MSFLLCFQLAPVLRDTFLTTLHICFVWLSAFPRPIPHPFELALLAPFRRHVDAIHDDPD